MVQIIPAGYALTAYSDNYSINILVAKASLSFCSLRLTVQILRPPHGCAVWAL